MTHMIAGLVLSVCLVIIGMFFLRVLCMVAPWVAGGIGAWMTRHVWQPLDRMDAYATAHHWPLNPSPALALGAGFAFVAMLAVLV